MAGKVKGRVRYCLELYNDINSRLPLRLVWICRAMFYTVETELTTGL